MTTAFLDLFKVVDHIIPSLEGTFQMLKASGFSTNFLILTQLRWNSLKSITHLSTLEKKSIKSIKLAISESDYRLSLSSMKVNVG